MPYGVSVSDESRTLSQIKNNFIRKIKKIIARYGFDDEEWAQAISSQYFLLCIAKQLKWGKRIMLICLISVCHALVLHTQVIIF